MLGHNLITGQFQLQMHKNTEIKGKKVAKKQGNSNILRKNVPADTFHYETFSKNCLIQLNSQKPKKDIQKSKEFAQKIPKCKKIKFLTEQIEKSVEGDFKIQPITYNKSNLIKFSTLNNLEDLNVYQRCKSARKDKRGDFINQLPKKIKQNNRVSLKNVNIKSRDQQKNHSKSNKKLQLKALGLKNITKSKSVPQSLCITERKGKQGRLLSPQVVQQQNSYYFSNYEDSQKNDSKRKNFEQKKSALQTNSKSQKKQNMFIYQSKQSGFRSCKPKTLNLGSTRDLLN